MAEEGSNAAAAGVESVLGTVGGLAEGAGGWLQERAGRTVSKTRPWLEFLDVSAFAPRAEGGLSEYMARVRANGAYFKYNYLKVGLALAVFSAVTQPLALVGCVLLVVAYFQLFGERAGEEVHVLGLALSQDQKVGALVLLGALVFFLGAGGLEMFSAIACSTIFVALVHGALRTPPPQADVSAAADPIV